MSTGAENDAPMSVLTACHVQPGSPRSRRAASRSTATIVRSPTYSIAGSNVARPAGSASGAGGTIQLTNR